MQNSRQITDNKFFRPFCSAKKSTGLTQTRASFFSSNRTVSSSMTRGINVEKSQLSRKNFKDNFSTVKQVKELQKQIPPLMIYFDNKLRKQYNQAIVNSYFVQNNNINEEQLQSPVFNRSNNKKYNRNTFNLNDLAKKGQGRLICTSELKKRDTGYLSSVYAPSGASDAISNISMKRMFKKEDILQNQCDKKLTDYASNKSFSQKQTYQKQSNLPIIDQQSTCFKRPISQQKPSRKIHSFSINTTNIHTNPYFVEFQTNSNGQLSAFSSKSQTEEFVQKQRNSQQQLFGNVQIVIRKQFHNQYFEIFKMFGNGIQQNRLKRFKKNGGQIYNRQKKIQKMNKIPLLWRQNEGIRSMKSNLSRLSLRQQLYKMVQQKRGQQDIFNIYPKRGYQKLFLNKNEWLIDVIVSICNQLKMIEGKVVHSKININNIYRIRQKQVMIDDWGYSGVKESLKVMDEQWTAVQNPLIGDQKDWLIIPEYMPPQMIQDYQSDWKSQYIWSTPSGTNMWLIGCLIFQILTLTPLWIPYRCLIKGQQQLKKGILSVKQRKTEQIAKNHKQFVSKAVKIAQKQSIGSKYGVNTHLIRVLQGCLKMKPEQRITPQQAIEMLKI